MKGESARHGFLGTVGAVIIDCGWIPGLPQPRGTGGPLDDLLPGVGLTAALAG
ncbi:hypothetical protein [Streptomyces thinghirensis]|uniref:hypothetical protein n=1 Tax=Streptomyces thinghirensis TaxID=551547 RepID=UPI0031E6D36E